MKPPEESGSRSAFTFVEILAAMTFLAILIPAVMTAITLSNRAAVTAERSRVAIQLAENQLNELLVANTWQAAGSNGDFGDDHPGYRWELSQQIWRGDINNPMTEITLSVRFPVQGQEREVHVTTLASSSLAQ